MSALELCVNKQLGRLYGWEGGWVLKEISANHSIHGCNIIV